MSSAGSIAKPRRVKKREALLIAPGDVRDSANLAAWPAQLLHEEAAARAFKDLGWTITRADTCAPHLRHGLIASQAQGRDVFARVHPEAPLVVAVSTWQYSHHTLIGLARHTGPILILANLSGRFPGLLGALNLRASLVKAGVRPSMLWTEDFKGADFRRKLRRWLDTGRVRHDASHVAEYDHERTPRRQRRLGEGIAGELRAHPPILGVVYASAPGTANRARDADAADRLLAVKCAAAHSLGIRVHLCGTTAQREPLAEYLARHP